MDLSPGCAKLLAPEISVHASMTAIDVSYNKIDQPSARLILEAMEGKNMQSIGMADCNLGVEEAKILAEYTNVMASLTVANLLNNNLDKESAAMLTKVAAEKKISLCGIGADETSATFIGQGLGPNDSILIASDLRVRASLTSADFTSQSAGARGS